MEENLTVSENIGEGEKKKSPFPKEQYKVISEDVLKWVALITMFIDHIGAGIIERCYLAEPNMYTIDTVIRAVGRLAFPIYCFLLVEGYTYTHSRWKYLLNLGIFALISEIPFDYLFRGGWTLTYQNVFFTLLLGMVVMMIAGKIEEKGWGAGGVILEIVACLGIGLVAEFLRTDYNSWGVILIFLLFICRNKPRWVLCLVGSLFLLTSSSEIPGIVSFILILFCNGKRMMKINKYVFYGLYPAHLALYCGIRYLLMM